MLPLVPSTNAVFNHDHVAWLRDSEVRFGRDNHAERLQLRGDVDTRFVVLDLNLAEVRRTPLRSNRPEDVGEIFRPELRRRREVIELRVDVDVPFLAADRGVAECERRKSSPCEIDFRVAFSWPVVDRRCCMANDSDPEDGHRALLRRWAKLLSGVGRLRDRGTVRSPPITNSAAMARLHMCVNLCPRIGNFRSTSSEHHLALSSQSFDVCGEAHPRHEVRSITFCDRGPSDSSERP